MGEELFAIAKKGKEWGREDQNIRRYEEVLRVSAEFKPFWEGSSERVASIPKEQMLSWSTTLHDIADKGLQYSDNSYDASRYDAISRIADEIQQETRSYFEEPDLVLGEKASVADTEFIADRNTAPRLIQMLERAEKEVLIASPWLAKIGEIVDTLEEARRKRHIQVKILTRPPKPGRDFQHEEAVTDLWKRGFHVEMQKMLHAKMILVDDEECIHWFCQSDI